MFHENLGIPSHLGGLSRNPLITKCIIVIFTVKKRPPLHEARLSFLLFLEAMLVCDIILLVRKILGWGFHLPDGDRNSWRP